jgi:hypothetical protein
MSFSSSAVPSQVGSAFASLTPISMELMRRTSGNFELLDGGIGNSSSPSWQNEIMDKPDRQRMIHSM